jgi:hypothetical protein
MGMFSPQQHGFRFLSQARILYQQGPVKEKPPQLKSKIEGFEEDLALQVPVKTKLKLLIRDYGGTVMVVHISLSLMSLGTCYCLVAMGVPVQAAMSALATLSDTALEYASSGGTFAIAYVIHKCLMPVRLTGTAIITPILVNYLRGKGILKKHHEEKKPLK